MSNWLFEEITYIARFGGNLRVILFCLKGMSCRLPACIFRSAEDGGGNGHDCCFEDQDENEGQ